MIAARHWRSGLEKHSGMATPAPAEMVNVTAQRQWSYVVLRGLATFSLRFRVGGRFGPFRSSTNLPAVIGSSCRQAHRSAHACRGIVPSQPPRRPPWAGGPAQASPGPAVAVCVVGKSAGLRIAVGGAGDSPLRAGDCRAEFPIVFLGELPVDRLRALAGVTPQANEDVTGSRPLGATAWRCKRTDVERCWKCFESIR